MARVAAFFSGIVNQPVADVYRGKPQKAPFQLLVRQNRLMEGQHGDGQFVVCAVGRSAKKFCRFRTDKGKVLFQEIVRCGGTFLRCVHLGDDLMLVIHVSTPAK